MKCTNVSVFIPRLKNAGIVQAQMSYMNPALELLLYLL